MKTKIIISVIGVFLALNACNEDNLNKQDPNNFPLDGYFKNRQELVTAVNSIYATVQGFGLVGREWFFIHDLRSDDMAAGGGQLETPRAQLLNGTHSPSNDVMNTVWRALYVVIHKSNVVIDRGPAVTDISALDKTRLVSEAKFLRAWAYFDLVTFWGGVPLYDHYAKELTETKGRSSENEVYTLIISDLTDAAASLPVSYEAADLGRVTKGAAQAMLGRVYMQRGDYTNAKTVLQDLIGSGTYRLVDNYYDNFSAETEFNKESIWEVGFANIGGPGWDGVPGGTGLNEQTVHCQEYSPVGWRNLIPSNSLLDEFERPFKGDAMEDPRLHQTAIFTGDRFANNTETLTDAAQNGSASRFNGVDEKISWLKYTLLYRQDPGGLMYGDIDERMIRYGEVLLMMAECENETGNPGAAIDRLNEIRARPSVNMPSYPTTRFPVSSQQEIRNAIIHEKRVEMAGEHVRNRDILRWRKLGHLTTEPISYFAPKYAQLPIPQQEIDANDKIDQGDQNLGY